MARSIHPRAQRGISLIEALIGFLVLSLGVVGAARLQSSMRLHADVARQRSEALQLAQKSIESLRATSLDASDHLADAMTSTPGATATFGLSRHVADASPSTSKATTVTVRWADRSGTAQSVSLDSIVAGTPAIYSALLTLPAQDRSIAPARQWPWGTRPFHDGRVVFKPELNGTQAWLFAPATGQVSAVCTVPAATPAGSLTEKDLTHCDAIQATLLSGFVRFSLGPAPDSEHPNDAPLPLSVELALSTSTPSPPLCRAEAHTDHGERFTSYACLVPISGATPGWSGRLDVVPQGWAIGSDAASRKVCRYSRDADGSGRIDRNDEHPAAYESVIGPLVQQNYLVIRGDSACSTPLQTHNAIPAATVQHQP